MFAPQATITRAEVTAIANRMLGRQADRAYIDAHEESLRSFQDNELGHWAYYDIVEATNGHDFSKENGEESWTGLTD